MKHLIKFNNLSNHCTDSAVLEDSIDKTKKRVPRTQFVQTA